MTKTKKYNTLKKSKSLIGGKYLGSGTYGCVVTPPLPCNSSHLPKHTFKNRNNKTKVKHSNNRNNKNNRNNRKYVSKIIKQSNDDTYHEINISKLIKKIDPEQHYFITYESVCKIKKVPNNRKNTEHVEYRDHSLKKYDVIDEYGNIKSSGYNHSNHNNNNNKNNHNNSIYNSYNSHNHKTDKCLIDTRLDPINIILPYGGYDLIDLKNNIDDMIKEYKKSKSLQSHVFIKTYTSIFNNFKMYFKNLVIGLYKLHKARIVNCDIKQENIMANYNTKTNKVDMRFIDFGFSEHLTDTYCKKYDNIKLFGTTVLISPDIFIADILNRYIKSGNIKKIKGKIADSIDENVKEMYHDLKAYDYIKMLYKSYETHDNKGKTTKHIPVIEEVYNDILKHFENKTILDAYFGTNTKTLDGYLQKADIYALGCSMYEFLTLDNTMIDVKKNVKLQHLLKKMIHPDPKKRYNSLECLKHPYFK